MRSDNNNSTKRQACPAQIGARMIRLELQIKPDTHVRHILTLCGYRWNVKYGWYWKPRLGNEKTARNFIKLAETQPESSWEDRVAYAAETLLQSIVDRLDQEHE